jgi:ComF family protein
VSARAWHSVRAACRGLYDDFQEFLAPSSCLCCGRSRDFDDKLLCPGCAAALLKINPGFGPACPFCGKMISSSACVSCHPPADLRMYYWGPYENELKECITQFKFHRARELGLRLTEMAHDSVGPLMLQVHYDIIVPVPLHRGRQRRRTYNQSELLAARLSELAGIESQPNLLVRARRTFQQAKLPEDQRWHNVRGAFSVPPKNETILGKKLILLVDDIVTTGATVYEASKPLLAAGAARVDIFSLAYAL